MREVNRSDVRLNCVTVTTMGQHFPQGARKMGLPFKESQIEVRDSGHCAPTLFGHWLPTALGRGCNLGEEASFKGEQVSQWHAAVSCQQPTFLALKEWSTLILEDLDDEPQCQLQSLSCDAWIHLLCNKLSLSGSCSVRNLTGFLSWETKKRSGGTAAHAAVLKFESGFRFLPLLHPIPHLPPLTRTYANQCLPGGPQRP